MFNVSFKANMNEKSLKLFLLKIQHDTGQTPSANEINVIQSKAPEQLANVTLWWDYLSTGKLLIRNI